MPHKEGHESGQHAPPLPPSNFNFDELKRWLATQTISAQKLITGSLQAGQEVGSANFVSGSAGWQITGDGDAEFNDVVVRGDIESGNWDGASPANLASRDGAATQGFYLDSSKGAAQFEGSVWIGGALTVDGATSLDSTLTMSSGSTIRTASSGARVELTNTDSDLLSFYNSSGLKGQIGATGDFIAEALEVLVPDDTFSNKHRVVFVSGDTDSNKKEVQIKLGRVLTDSDPGEVGGSSSNPQYSFISDIDTGVRSVSADRGGLVSNSTDRMWWDNSGVWVRTIPTTASAADMKMDTSGLIHRSTSSLAYKPDWRWARDLADLTLPTPIRWTDEKGQTRLGFGAEHVHEAVGEAYEQENYDLRSLVAILSEKVKRLEGRTSLPRRLLAKPRRLVSQVRGLLHPYRAK